MQSSATLVTVPKPISVTADQVPGGGPISKTGTVVCWTRADRLDNRRPTTIHRKLRVTLGRVLRYFILERCHGHRRWRARDAY